MAAAEDYVEVRRVYVPYTPRRVFLPYHQRTERWSTLVCHRRAGKTTTLLADRISRALRGPEGGRYCYVAPLYSQAKSIAWDILLGLTESVRENRNESELRVDLPGNRRIRLYGGDNPDSLRGNKFHGADLDETGDLKHGLFTEVIRPALADTGGDATFAGTPKGVGFFRDLYETATRSDDWFTLYLPASVTGILSKAELDDARALMTPEVYAQEFECSWTAPRTGSYYGELLEASELEGRIGDWPHDPDQPVSVAFDLGYRDSTAAWYWQPRPGGFAVIDHDEANGRTVDDWVALLRAKGYEYDTVWLPHDARAKSLQTGRSTVEQMLAAKLPCRVVPQLKVQQGIDAARMVLPRCYFHEPTTHVGLRRLRQYGRLWNDARQVFSDAPRHDEASHSADAFRYLALVARDFEGTPKGPSIAHGSVGPLDGRVQLDVLWADRAAARPGGAHAIDG